mmetsp:Transcript_126657/g.358274  ORF Transcript_126657/g.358274 Transcript_126657/m.358274 type:complete len:210 (-) Transcript_126657:1292-1921(-)
MDRPGAAVLTRGCSWLPAREGQRHGAAASPPLHSTSRPAPGVQGTRVAPGTRPPPAGGGHTSSNSRSLATLVSSAGSLLLLGFDGNFRATRKSASIAVSVTSTTCSIMCFMRCSSMSRLSHHMARFCRSVSAVFTHWRRMRNWWKCRKCVMRQMQVRAVGTTISCPSSPSMMLASVTRYRSASSPKMKCPWLRATLLSSVIAGWRRKRR